MEYVAQVVNPIDPGGRKLVQVRVFEKFPEVIPDYKLPWAEIRYSTPVRFNEGAYISCKKGDWCWVDFPFNDSEGNEDTRKPRITGFKHYTPDTLPNLPHEAFSGPLSIDGMHERPDDIDIEKPDDIENADAFSFWGVVLQFIKNGALRITQKASKSAIEISKTGNIGLFSGRHVFLSAIKGKIKLIAREIVFKAAKSLELDIGKIDIKASSVAVNTSGDLELKGGGKSSLTGGKIDIISAQGGMNISSAGAKTESVSGLSSETVVVDSEVSPVKGKEIKIEANGVEVCSIVMGIDGSFTLKNSGGAEMGADSTGLMLMKNKGATQHELLKGILDELGAIVVAQGTGPNPAKVLSLQSKLNLLWKQ